MLPRAMPVAAYCSRSLIVWLVGHASFGWLPGAAVDLYHRDGPVVESVVVPGAGGGGGRGTRRRPAGKMTPFADGPARSMKVWLPMPWLWKTGSFSPRSNAFLVRADAAGGVAQVWRRPAPDGRLWASS